MLDSAQIRAARSLLNWRQEDLAQQSHIGIATIQRIEKANGPVMGNVSTQLKIKQAFEKAGIIFIDVDNSGGIGVRLKTGNAKKIQKSKN